MLYRRGGVVEDAPVGACELADEKSQRAPEPAALVACIAPRRLRGGAFPMMRCGAAAVLVAVLGWVTLSGAQPDLAAAAACTPKNTVHRWPAGDCLLRARLGDDQGARPNLSDHGRKLCDPSEQHVRAGRHYRRPAPRGASIAPALLHPLQSCKRVEGVAAQLVVDGKRYRAAAGTRITRPARASRSAGHSIAAPELPAAARSSARSMSPDSSACSSPRRRPA